MSAPEDFAEQVRTLFGLSAPTPFGDTVEDAQENARLTFRDSSLENDSNSTFCEHCACRITAGKCKHGVTPPPSATKPRKPAAPPVITAPPVFAVAPDKLDPDTYKGNALAARVAAANRANYLIGLYHAYIVEKLRPFLNQKVLKNTSWGTTLTKKVSEAIGDAITPENSGERFSISTQGHWITVRCNVSRHYEQYRHQSWEAYSTVGKTGGTDILQALETEPVKLRTDYNESEIRGKRLVVAGLNEQLRHAKSALDGWGEYDNR